MIGKWWLMCPLINNCWICTCVIELVDSISRDELDAPLMQYITNAGITRARYTTHFKHHHHVLWLISNRNNTAIYLRTARSNKSQFGILSSVDLAR